MKIKLYIRRQNTESILPCTSSWETLHQMSKCQDLMGLIWKTDMKNLFKKKKKKTLLKLGYIML